MITVKEVESIHQVLITSFGGAHGIRDLQSLQSAITRPFQTFDGLDLYATPFEKTAALLESILINHPFVDGNKRTGYTLYRLLLIQNGYDINASEDKKYEFIVGIASGNIKYESIVVWTAANTV
jgi:death on curing protein